MSTLAYSPDSPTFYAQLQAMGCLQQYTAIIPVAVPQFENCVGTARVLQGNPLTIGQPGGFSGTTVGNILVTANGAAIIPSQWASSKSALRPYLSQVSGVFPLVGASFQGIVDVWAQTGQVPAGFPPDSNVQQDLMQLYPGQLIIELPGAPKDYGSTQVQITVPVALGCPQDTTVMSNATPI